MFVVFLRLCAVFLMIGLGWLARTRGVVDGPTTNRLARLLTFYVYPALIFSSMVQRFTLASLVDKWLLPAGSFGIMATGFVAGLILLPWFGGRRSAQGRGFHFQATINNYSFLAMPLALFYWGEEGLANVIFSTLGGELAMWTLGVYALTETRLSRASLRRLVSPPIMAVFAALATIAIRDGLGLADGLAENRLALALAQVWQSGLDGLSVFGGATIPVAMVVAGSRIADLGAAHVIRLRQLRVVAVRLIVVPALAVIWISRLPIPTDIANVLVLIAVMPSAVSSVMLSEIFDGDVEFAAASVLLTHLCCLLTVPLWFYLFGF